MNSSEFRNAANEMAKYIVHYKEMLKNLPVIPKVKPGYLPPLLSRSPPNKPETWDDVIKDLDEKIVPGLCHWQHPQFYSYFPNAGTYPGILGDMISGALGINSTSWTACPASTELETQMMDWFGRALGLPKHFIFSEPGSTGGGVFTTSASEAILCAVLAARVQALKYLQEKYTDSKVHESVLLPKLVLYCSSEAHSCVEKAAMISMVQLRILDVDDKFALRGDIVQEAIDADLTQGLHPFFVLCTVGTTGTTAIDNIKEIGPIVRGMPACWLHVDGAYGGSSFICPEMRGPMEGFELVDSFNFNSNKWLLVNAESSSLFVKDKIKLKTSLVDDTALYQTLDMSTPHEYRHWGIPMGRRFRALKVWMTLKSYGIEGIQRVIRCHCTLAKLFEGYVRADDRFEVVNHVQMGLVCFRLKGNNDLTEKLLDNINDTGKVHMIPSAGRGMYFIRFAVTSEHAEKEQIDYAWKVIQEKATELLSAAEDTKPLELNEEQLNRRRATLVDFGTMIDEFENKSKTDEEIQDQDEAKRIKATLMKRRGTLADFGTMTDATIALNVDADSEIKYKAMEKLMDRRGTLAEFVRTKHVAKVPNQDVADEEEFKKTGNIKRRGTLADFGTMTESIEKSAVEHSKETQNDQEKTPIIVKDKND